MMCQYCGEKLPKEAIKSKQISEDLTLGRRVSIRKTAVCPTCQHKNTRYYYTDKSTKNIALGGQL